MEKEKWFIKMKIFMKDNGKMILDKEKESWYFKIKIFIKDNGIIMYLMVKIIYNN
jgi:hypothetical protein